MKLLIVEPYYHASYLYATLRIAQSAGHDILIITTSRVWKEVRLFSEHDLANRNGFKVDIVDRLDDLYRAAIQASAWSDLVMFNTLQVLEWQNLARLAFARWPAPVVFTIHNPTYWFNHSGYPLWRVRAKIRHLCRNRILRRFDGIIFLSEQMIDYARRNDYHRPIGLLPYGVAEGITLPPDQLADPISFGVPGTISPNRDYDTLLDAFEQISSQQPGRLSLALLGPPAGEFGQRIKNRCLALIGQGCDIRLLDQEHYVSEAVLAAEIGGCDFLILPVSASVFPDGLKVSGTVYDAIRFAKPFIIPESYLLPSHVQGGYLTYQNEMGLRNALKSCLEGGAGFYKGLCNDMTKNAGHCTPNAWVTAFHSFCLEVYKTE